VSVRAVCFDLLSALLDSWSVWDGVAASLERSELGRVWRRRYLALTSTTGSYRAYLDLVAEAARDVGLPASASSLLEARWPGLEPWPDVRPALSSLGVPAAVVTNCSESLGQMAAARVGIAFGVVVTAEAAGAYKPHPATYQLACDRLGLAPAEVAYVAGSPFDARGALAFGFPVSWVNRLGDPPPPDASRFRILPSLSGWTP
jgi:2-haloacid dehalogenase